MRRAVLIAVVLSTFAGSIDAASSRRRAVRPPPVPDGPCQVRGLANFFYSNDGGRTFSVNAQPPAQAGAWQIGVFVDDPNRIVTSNGPRVMDSTDAGCTWIERFTIPDQFKHKLHVVPATAGRAFLWTEEFTYRYDSGVVVQVVMPETIGGLAVDPGNREHVRILGLTRGNPYESFDGGANWQPMGGEAGGFVTASAYDPSDINRIVAGVMGRGVVISRDGGKTWTSGVSVAPRSVCEIELVPKQPNVIWIELSLNSGQPSVIRSADGGVTAQTVATMTTVDRGLCLPLTADPHNTNLAYIPFRQLYTFDAAARTVSASTCCGGGNIQRIAHSPVDSNRVYIYASQP